MNKMLNIVLFGPPGAGKGTQSQKLIDKYNLVHLSTGDLLRSEIARGTVLGTKAKSIMDRGELVSDDIVIGMIESKLDSNPNAKGFIFDGFPRTTAQAVALDELLQRKHSAISMMLALEVDNAELTRRLLNRGQETGRADDQSEDIIRNRINEYNTKTAPLKQYYSHQSKFHSVYGMGDVDQIFELLCATIENKSRGKDHVHNDGTVTVADVSFDDEPVYKNHSNHTDHVHHTQDEPEVEIEIVEMPKAEAVKVIAPKKAVKSAVKKVAVVAKPIIKKATPAKKEKKVAKKSTPKKVAKKTVKVAPKKVVKKAVKKVAPKKVAKKIVKKALKKLTKKVTPKKQVKKIAKKAAKKIVRKAAKTAPKKAVKKVAKKAVKKAPAKKATTKKKKR